MRGKGLLIGMEIQTKHSAHDICLEFLKYGLLTKETHKNIIRFAPPLIITTEQIDFAVEVIKTVLAKIN